MFSIHAWISPSLCFDDNAAWAYWRKYSIKVLFLAVKCFAVRLSSHRGNQTSGVCVSLHTRLWQRQLGWWGKLECKTISAEEERQPVGMFPLGCLEWINLSNCLPSGDRLYAHTASSGCKQAERNLHMWQLLFTHLQYLGTCYTLAFSLLSLNTTFLLSSSHRYWHHMHTHPHTDALYSPASCEVEEPFVMQKEMYIAQVAM